MDKSGILGSNKGKYGQIRQLRANMPINHIKSCPSYSIGITHSSI